MPRYQDPVESGYIGLGYSTHFLITLSRMRLMVSSKLNAILFATVRFTFCGIPTNMYKKYRYLLFPQCLPLLLRPLLTILDRSSFRRLADTFFVLAYVSRRKRINYVHLPRQRQVAYIKRNFIITNFFLPYFKS
jgi:hypothetical protein